MKNTIKKITIMTLVIVLCLCSTAFAKAKLSKSATVKQGETITLKVKDGKATAWKSSNKKVATVKKGKVKGLSAGTTTIKAKVNGKTLTCKVTVKANEQKTETTQTVNTTYVSGNASTADTKTEVTTEIVVPVDPEQANIYHALISMKAKYPEGTPFTNDNFYIWNGGGALVGGYGCAAFAMELSDSVFGDAEAIKHTNFDNIKTGDIVRMDYNSHSVIVLSNNGNELVVAEGNYNGTVHWGRHIPLSEVKATGTYVMTRY